MRCSWILVAALVLGAGCADKASPPADATDAAEGFVPPSNVPAGFPPAMKFLAGEFDQTLIYEGTFTYPNTCLQADCQQVVEFDLTDQVPADAAVDLTATTEADTNCVDPSLRIEDGDSVREVNAANQTLAARVVRASTGTVTLRLLNCTVMSRDAASGSPVHAEVRTAVRPTVLPTRMPVSVELATGDRLLGMGEDMQQFVVYPPGLPPVRLEGSFEFNATVAGNHVVAAIGTGETMLHGPGVPMVALPVRTTAGKSRPVPSGQDLSWDVEVPGIPVGVTMELSTEGAPVSYLGTFSLSAGQASQVFFNQVQDCPVAPCGVGATTYSWWRYGSGMLPEGIGVGPITFTVTNAQSMGYRAVETVSWVAPPTGA